jgi:hypothetical protein
MGSWKFEVKLMVSSFLLVNLPSLVDGMGDIKADTP